MLYDLSLLEEVTIFRDTTMRSVMIVECLLGCFLLGVDELDAATLRCPNESDSTSERASANDTDMARNKV